MYPIKCGFCQHGNPPNSRFCNSCGAPLAAEPCPHCGAVNDIMATACQKCEAPLADSLPNDLFLPLPPEMPANARSATQPTEGKTGPDHAHRRSPDGDGALGTAPSAHAGPEAFHDDTHLTTEPCPRCGARNEIAAATCQNCDAPLADSSQDELFLPLAPEAPASPGSASATTDRATDPDPARAHPPDEDGLRGHAPSANAGAETSQGVAASGPRRRGLTTAAILAALVVAVYFAYRQFQTIDVAPSAATSGGANVGSIPAAPVKPIAAPAAATRSNGANPVVGADAPAAVPAPDRGASTVTQAQAPGGDAGAKGGPSKDLFSGDPARLQAPTDTAKGPNPDQRRAPLQVQETPKTSATGTAGEDRRQSTNAGAGVAQRPPGRGPCTDALAALGLCTKENTQRREP